MMTEEKIVKRMRGGDASAMADGIITDVRSYLRDVRHRYSYAQTLSERASRYREMAMRATGRMDALRLSGTARRSKVEDNVLAMMDVQKEWKERIDALMQETQKAEKLISVLTDPRHRSVLHLRYLSGMGWEEIAGKMQYTLRWVHKLHSEAIEMLQRYVDKRGH